jgi:gliding motility-associated-like protein
LDGSASVTASGGKGAYTYSWLPVGGSNAVASNLSTGTYTVTVTDKNGCTGSAIAKVGSLSLFKGIAGNDTTILEGGSAQLFAKNGSTFSWVPDVGLSCNNCPDPIASPSVTTTYTLTIDSNTCTSNAYIKVTVEPVPCRGWQVYVPNAFSPNGDGHNDLECVYTDGTCIQALVFNIYDRWGNKVFESVNGNNCWDGTYKGRALNTGEFAYYMSAVLANGSTVSKKGNIALVK